MSPKRYKTLLSSGLLNASEASWEASISTGKRKRYGGYCTSEACTRYRTKYKKRSGDIGVKTSHREYVLVTQNKQTVECPKCHSVLKWREMKGEE